MKFSDAWLKLRKNPPEDAAEAAAGEVQISEPKEKKAKKPALPVGQAGRIPVLPETERLYPQLHTYIRVFLAAALIAASVFVKALPGYAVTAMRIAAALGAGYDLALDMAANLRRKVFSCDGLPVFLAAILAFVNKMSLEAAIAVTVFQIAVSLRHFAYVRVRNSLISSVSLPENKTELLVGDTFMVDSGQIVPADCIILQGSITADMGFLRGDPVEKHLKTGDSLPAGCKAISGSILAEVTRAPGDTDVAEIASAISGGFENLTRTETTINKCMNFFMPALVILGAAMLAVFTFALKLDLSESLRRVLTLIVIASPCGILICVPPVYLAAIIAQKRAGCAFLDSCALDNAAYAKTVALDKLGTITSDVFEVSEISTDKMDKETFLKVAAHTVSGSVNPMANAILAAYAARVSGNLIKEFAEYPGWGVSVKVENIDILLGTGGFMLRNQIQASMTEGGDCVLYMAVNGALAGRISLKNKVDLSAADTVKRLAAQGIDRVVMVSGDGRESDGVIAREVGVNEYFSECSQAEKARQIYQLRSRIDAKSAIVYASAPYGSVEAAEAADLTIAVSTSNVYALEGIVDALLLSGGIKKLPAALMAGKRTRRAAALFVLAGLAVKLVLAALALTGTAPLWINVAADACIAPAMIAAAALTARGK